MSIISAVTRKRKKFLNTNHQGCSTDEDSEHEQVKASNYGGEEGGEGEEEREREEKETIKGEDMISNKEKTDEKEKWVKTRETAEGKDTLTREKEVEKDVVNETGKGSRNLERKSSQRRTLLGKALHLCPNSFLCSA